MLGYGSHCDADRFVSAYWLVGINRPSVFLPDVQQTLLCLHLLTPDSQAVHVQIFYCGCQVTMLFWHAGWRLLKNARAFLYITGGDEKPAMVDALYCISRIHAVVFRGVLGVTRQVEWWCTRDWFSLASWDENLAYHHASSK
jgi:hypothetical protein